MIVVRRLILAGFMILAMTPAAAQDQAVTAGRSIATLTRVPLKSRNGAHILLGSRIRRGKPTLISIWSSWCPPCIAEAPYLNQLRKDLGGGFNFIYVNRVEGDPDPEQPPEATARFLANAGLSDIDYVVADVPAARQILGEDVRDVPIGKVGVPRIYLFNRNGRQIFASYGFSPEDGPALEQRVREAIAR
jgi:thiol-disulfide isomerase/thioredoxin